MEQQGNLSRRSDAYEKHERLIKGVIMIVPRDVVKDMVEKNKTDMPKANVTGKRTWAALVDPHLESTTNKSEIVATFFFGRSSPGVNDRRK